jgi:hypothetical protein
MPIPATRAGPSRSRNRERTSSCSGAEQNRLARGVSKTER